MQEQKYVIIVAGGSGKRMGLELPKQFIVVGGKPIIMHSIECFFKSDSAVEIILVLPENQHAYWNELMEEYKFYIPHKLTIGGAERFDSVRHGLDLIQGKGLVAVHDGVRPLVSADTIYRCFVAAEQYKAAIPVMPSTESIRMQADSGNIAVDRSKYMMVQTPQVFDSSLLKEAYSQAKSNTFTDDASVVEGLGEKITMVEGNPENIKVTRPMDLIIAEALMNDLAKR